VLIVTGEADERIPIEYVDRQSSELEEGGVVVTYRQFPGEDHFLFFSQPSAVLDVVAAWLLDNAD
jgi:pimeloyl-ACP methyl ester carboxylesterase